MIQTIKLALAGIAVAAAALFVAVPAQAQVGPYNCKTNLPPTNVTGDIVVNDNVASCDITYPLTATGYISIVNTGGSITTKALTISPTGSNNPGNLYVSASTFVQINGAVLVKTNTSIGGSVVMDAGTTLQAQTITTSFGGYIDLQAQKSTGNAPFVIGTSGTNGVGKLTTSGTNIPGTDYTTQTSTIVHVSNGPESGTGTGGITVTSLSDLAVTNGGGSRNGGVILDAQQGDLIIPSGSLNLSGNTSLPLTGGGQIVFIADNISFAASSSLDTSQTSLTPIGHQINLVANTITYGTLTLKSNGNGVPVGAPQFPAGLPGAINFYSPGKITISDTQNPDTQGKLTTLTIFTNYQDSVALSPLTISGTGTLTASANGDNTQVQILAYPVTISGATFNLSSTGNINHFVGINNGDNAIAGSPGLTFNATGNVTMDASGTPSSTTSSMGGAVYFFTSSVNLSSPNNTFLLKANGNTTGPGDGGIAAIEVAGSFTLDPTTTLTVEANASSASTGNAQKSLLVSELNKTDPFKAIELTVPYVSTINLGTGPGLISLSATGGKTGGDGGAILVDSNNYIEVKNSLAVNASALGQTGQGGDIQLRVEDPFKAVSIDWDPSQVTQIKATGGTVSGQGGTVLANHANTPNLIAINVSQSIDVDGGSTLWQTGGFDGSISLNGKSCTQQAVGTSWPKSYWDCALANPTDAPTSRESAIGPAAQSLPTSFKTTLGNNNASLWIYATPTDYVTFTADPNASGVTTNLPAGYNVPILATAEVFETTGGTRNVTQYLQGDMMHEVGHLVDYETGTPSQSSAFMLDGTSVIKAVTGAWPLTPTPACAQVFGTSADANTICASLVYPPPANSKFQSPWDVYTAFIIGGTTQTLEMAELYAESFQYCSGYQTFFAPTQFVETSYQTQLQLYMAAAFAGGCRAIQPPQP